MAISVDLPPKIVNKMLLAAEPAFGGFAAAQVSHLQVVGKYGGNLVKQTFVDKLQPLGHVFVSGGFTHAKYFCRFSQRAFGRGNVFCHVYHAFANVVFHNGPLLSVCRVLSRYDFYAGLKCGVGKATANLM